MDELLAYRQRLLLRLEQVPSDFETIIQQAVEFDLPQPPNPGAYSLRQHIAHVRDAEKFLFLPAFQRILKEKNPRIEDIEDLGWVTAPPKVEEHPEKIWQEIAALHHNLIATLEDMDMREWSREARHPRVGLHTLQWWVERCLTHAEEHLSQVKAMFGRQIIAH